jgi:uncharacterized OsmC-like protein
MLIRLHPDDRLRLEPDAAGLGFEMEDGATLSPFHLLAASLATCTYAALHGWATNAGIPLDGLAIDVGWEIGGEPYRVTAMEMILDWPGLPAKRRAAAARAAAQCTVHATLEHGSAVDTRVRETAQP